MQGRVTQGRQTRFLRRRLLRLADLVARVIWNPMNMAVTCQKKKRKDQNVSDFFSPALPVSSDGGFFRNAAAAAAPPQKNMHHHFPPPTVILYPQDNSGWLARSLDRLRPSPRSTRNHMISGLCRLAVTANPEIPARKKKKN